MSVDECSSKRLKLELPDSGCDCNSDKMDTEDNSPPVKVVERERTREECLSDLPSSDADHSSGVFSDDSESKNKLAKSCKR